MKKGSKIEPYISSRLHNVYSYESVRWSHTAGICACGSIRDVCARVQANDGPGHSRLKEMRCSEGKTQALALTLTYMTDVYWMFLLLWVVSLSKDKTTLASFKLKGLWWQMAKTYLWSERWFPYYWRGKYVIEYFFSLRNLTLILFHCVPHRRKHCCFSK